MAVEREPRELVPGRSVFRAAERRGRGVESGKTGESVCVCGGGRVQPTERQRECECKNKFEGHKCKSSPPA